MNQTITSAFPGRYSSVRHVDFRNLKPLKNGRYRKDEGGIHYSEQPEKVYYLVNDQVALALYSWFSVGGSSSQGGVAQVFKIVEGTLRSIQKISWDTHFQTDQPFVTFNANPSTLVIRSAHYIPGDAHCCVSAMDVVTFRWEGALFAQAGLQTELSEYGKKEGRTLPR